MKPIIACGTEDGESLYGDHFGESPYFNLYELKPGGHEFIEKLDNITREEKEEEEEDLHGDLIKAKNISSLLKTKSVNVLLAHQIGPNIVKVSKNFVPVISRETDLETSLDLVKDKLHIVEREWRKGEKREHLVLGEDQEKNKVTKIGRTLIQTRNLYNLIGLSKKFSLFHCRFLPSI